MLGALPDMPDCVWVLLLLTSRGSPCEAAHSSFLAGVQSWLSAVNHVPSLHAAEAAVCKAETQLTRVLLALPHQSISPLFRRL